MAQASAITPEMKKAIGVWRLPDFPPQELTIWNIKQYAAATEDPNPLWVDGACAKKTRWGGIIAPPPLVEIFNPPFRCFREYAGEENLRNVMPFAPPFGRTYMGGEDFEFLIPLRPGDAVHCKAVIGNIYEKQSSNGGVLVFIEQHKEYRNQRDEIVARTKWTTIHPEQAPKAALAGSPPQTKTSAKPAKLTAEQVYFEDVREGMEIPSMEKHYTVTTIVKWAAATGDVGRAHFDADFMKNVYGVPGVVAHGPLGGVYLSQLITNWIGGWGALRKHTTQYRSNVYPRDVITFQGKVTRKWTDHGENLIECDTWGENEHGTKTAIAKSIVSLPLKSQSK